MGVLDGLVTALAADGLEHYVPVLAPESSALAAAARDGLKTLLNHLKDVGVSKMGQRQKIAKLIQKLLEEEEEEEEEEECESDGKPRDEDTGSFWAGMISANQDLTSAGDLGAVQLDASLYTDRMRVLPRSSSSVPTPPPEAPPLDNLDVTKRTDNAYSDDTHGPRATCEQLSAYRERGNVAFGRKDYAAAERWYEKLLAIPADDGAAGMHADHAAALSNLAACALARAPPDPAAAMLRLKPLLSSCPKHVKGRLRAGRCCVMLGELQAALTHYEVAFDVEKPKTPKEGLKLRWAPPTADVDPERRKLLGPDGKTPLSENAQLASDGKVNVQRLLSHGERSRSLAAQGRTDEALYLARSVQRACTHAAVGEGMVVGILEAGGRLWEAQVAAEDAVDKCPDDERMGVALARLLARRGKVAEAEAKLAQLVRSRPGEDSRAARALRGLKSAVALKAQGNTSYAAGDYERAAAHYSAALETDVEGCLKPTLHANRAQARLQDGRTAEALCDCDVAIALDADNVKLLLRRASCHETLKQPKKAKEDYEAVLKLEPACEVAAQYVEKATRAEKARRRVEGDFGSGGGEGDDAVDDEDEIDPYDLLGVPRDANAAAIKSQFRKLALKWHPDKHADATAEGRAEAEDTFRKVNLANTILTDPVKKRMYDAGGRIRDIMK